MVQVATVSYLNARPLIEGVERETDIELVRRVPSRLLETLESGAASVALCPVIDFQQSASELEIVPCGAIGCDGPALTVKVFSSRPINDVREVSVDGDSHTSVALLQIVMLGITGRRPILRPLSTAGSEPAPEALLLIGDKVVNAEPDRKQYPHQLDLGEAWRELSGNPFVFAVWMTRVGTDLGDLPERLDRIRQENHHRLTEIATLHARTSGWPMQLAVRYLSHNLRYELGSPELEGIEEFWRRCREMEIIDVIRPMRLYEGSR